MLSLDLINRTFNTPFRSVLDDDIKMLKEFGFDPDWIEIAGNRYLVDASSQHIGTQYQREMLRRRQKETCGMIAASLVMGLPPFDAKVVEFIEGGEELEQRKLSAKRRDDLREKFSPHFTECWSQEQIIQQLVGKKSGARPQGAAHGKALRVAGLLREIWMESTIRLFLESGTTTDRAAHYLRDITLPSPYSLLRGVTVCTNSRGIFETLGSFEVPIRTEVIGGYQLDNSETLVGPISEASLTNGTLAPFSMAILGATMADMRKQVLCTDTPEERAVKHAAYSRAQLRICVIDDSKFQDSPIRESYCFSKLIPDQIDLLITNDPLDENGNKLKGPRLKPFEEKINTIRDSGVPVLIGFLDPNSMWEQYARGTEIRTRIGNRLLERLRQDVRYARHRQTDAVEMFFNDILADYYKNQSETPDAPEVKWITKKIEKVSKAVQASGNQESPYARAKRDRQP